jgi:hypothetical protein
MKSKWVSTQLAFPEELMPVLCRCTHGAAVFFEVLSCKREKHQDEETGVKKEVFIWLDACHESAEMDVTHWQEIRGPAMDSGDFILEEG